MNDAIFTRSQNNRGLTEREKTAWPPHKKDMSFMTFLGWMCAIFAIILFILFVHENIEPRIPVAHAEEKQLTDFQQERLYCSQWMTGKKPVDGGTTNEIRNHCNKYL